jgi:uncharacterized membrane protein YphA (DoxX/SURF4 family)
METTRTSWATPAVRWLALLLLCAAYLQGPAAKLSDFPAALAEMRHFGMTPAPLFAAGVIAFELATSVMILADVRRGPAALALAAFTLATTCLALRFWEQPAGMERTMAANAFFEHPSLVGGFLLVAWHVAKDPAR